MAGNNSIIQIKRSTSTATPASLANGELAYSGNGNHLFIGRPDGAGIDLIGGAKFGYLDSAVVGTSIANAALIVGTDGLLANLSLSDLKLSTYVVNAISSDISVDNANTSLATASAVKSYVDNAVANVTVTYAANAGYADTAGSAANATYADTAGSAANATYATSAGSAANATYADSAGSAANATYADSAGSAANATYADSAGSAANATYATSAGSAANATYADSAGSAANATYADSAGSAANATYADSAGSANTADYFGGTSATGGTAGQVLKSNGDSGTVWANVEPSVAGLDTQVQFNDNGALAGDADFTFDKANNVLSVGGGLYVGGTGKISLSTDFVVNSSSLDFAGANVNATSATLNVLDAVVSGNLTVLGTTTTVATETLVVSDPLIKLANGNTSDTSDIGFFGLYSGGFSGLYRDASSSNTTSAVFKLFQSSGTEPTGVVDDTSDGYGLSTLHAYLNSGALVSGPSSLTITANSSVSVDITANTISGSIDCGVF